MLELYAPWSLAVTRVALSVIIAYRDGDGEFLTGEHTYRLHVPAEPPAGLFWAATAYNVTDGTMPETVQLLPSTNSYYDIPKNDDGSLDLYFGPTQPDGVADATFVQTIPGRHFLVAFRLYGTEHPFYDQTWRLDDIVKSNDPARFP